MSRIILRLDNIHKTFDEAILNGISLDIEEGEFITLLGSSGCGKTTTLRIIAGLEQPDSGRVLLNDQDVTGEPPNKRNVNTVFQNYALFPHMNVEENIGYGLKIQKCPKEDIHRKVAESLHLVQMEGFEKRKIHELSGGQKQRVAIARAIVKKPQILLLDEPLGALDLQLRRQMQLELKRLQKKLGITFIYITHDQEEAINMSDRIVVMNEGKFEQIGTPDEVYNRPRTSFVARFMGNANVLDAELLGEEKGRLYAVRSENIAIGEDMDSFGDEDIRLSAVVSEKSFAGGLLRMAFTLSDGEEVIASRHGINYRLEVGEKTVIGFKRRAAVLLEDRTDEEKTN